ncbi:hypothetical protein DNTS_018074 [Danionella cerebrum]|uniref:protein-glutamine gamma-glutamyltransferase n=1 Tax=Danionella cerebrum TaxID=2873325 RepID=A0A553QGV0_9TELE|nr:hypothetical protein DNTS_018074 [Danionella translucida]
MKERTSTQRDESTSSHIKGLTTEHRAHPKANSRPPVMPCLDLSEEVRSEKCRTDLVSRAPDLMEVCDGRGSARALLSSVRLLIFTGAGASSALSCSSASTHKHSVFCEDPLSIMSRHSYTHWHLGLSDGRFPIASSNSDEYNPLEIEDIPPPHPHPRGPGDDSSALSVLDVDMCLEKNKSDHYTDYYNNPNLIVRRNREFRIILKLNRAFNKNLDNLQLEIMIGSLPDINKGTSIVLSIGSGKPEKNWKSNVLETTASSITVGITPDVKCIIGRFRMFAVVVSYSGKKRTPRNTDTDFYVLFNPWDPEDEVYIEDDNDREEYVMNDIGFIYNGDYDMVASRSWNYGQFEEGILDACLLVMDAGKVPMMFRGKATEIVRQASALMNANDDNGVLVGNWSGDYSRGTAPSAWTGSTEILLQYAQEGCKPVQYAQCWVFAGVLNTFLRCLGIPTRVITNFLSAHDNNGSIKTEIVLDKSGNIDRRETKDSIWNFHCWNEVYMRRLDLPDQFSGWQVVDSTPQENSDGLFRCGPTSVEAIKQGEISYPFDARFVFAEVNSDVIYYQKDQFGKSKTLSVDTSYIGKLIVTKRNNSSNYMDVTLNYKYAEGSHQERQAMQRAEKFGVPSRDYLDTTESEVDVEIQADNLKIGKSFPLTVNFTNKSSQTCTVDAVITGSVVYYTGVISSTFMFENKTATVDAFGTQSIMMYIKASAYMPFLKDQTNLKFMVSGNTEETNTPFSTMRVFTLLPPDISIKVIGTPQVGKNLMITVEFQNPFQFSLQGVQLRLDGPGVMSTKMKEYSEILPGSSLKYKVMVIPQMSGRRVLMATLDCPQLREVTGQLEINVLAAG